MLRSVQEIVSSAPVTTSRRGAFWVGIEPFPGPLGTVMRGPMFVEWEAPAEPRPGPPWVLVHGGGGQATDYTVTPDGRPGWSRLLVEQGHTVFVVDRPGHGRSPHHPDILGPMGPQLGFEFLRPIFVPPPEGPDSNPTAQLHTQWPGGREPGDPVYDQTLCTSGPLLADPAEMHALEQRRLAELLHLVGPAVVVTHSAGGPGTFAGVDAGADKVAALIAIETLGPPFAQRPEMGLDMVWGLACAPIAYDPPVTDPSELKTATEERPELGPIPITLQQEPARRLANLSRFPIAVVTAEASMFLAYDRHLVEFLKQGGCDVELVRLADHGVHGNGHAMMLERNHEEVLGVLTDWVARKLGG
ncbi:MAG: alpha/beta fold hydrolase [Solirubrobacterales bacterium]|nr:alpha/beta fold hydrolase [Solirubrobacterales bacterium]MBV9714033.1 alpha/beta fold hydrolase [Solirubrobacterales bacterium]